MTRRSAGGSAIVRARMARACSVWMQATCTALGPRRKPGLDDAGPMPAAVSFVTGLRDDLAAMREDQDRGLCARPGR